MNIIKNRIARNCGRLNEYKVIKRILVRKKKLNEIIVFLINKFFFLIFQQLTDCNKDNGIEHKHLFSKTIIDNDKFITISSV